MGAPFSPLLREGGFFFVGMHRTRALANRRKTCHDRTWLVHAETRETALQTALPTLIYKLGVI